MHTHSSPIVSVYLIETYRDIPSGLMHNQGLKQNADLKQQIIIVKRTLDLIKEEMKRYPRLSWMNYIQPIELKCRVSENRMSMILCTMTGYEISIVPFFEKHMYYPADL